MREKLILVLAGTILVFLCITAPRILSTCGGNTEALLCGFSSFGTVLLTLILGSIITFYVKAHKKGVNISPFLTTTLAVIIVLTVLTTAGQISDTANVFFANAKKSYHLLIGTITLLYCLTPIFLIFQSFLLQLKNKVSNNSTEKWQYSVLSIAVAAVCIYQAVTTNAPTSAAFHFFEFFFNSSEFVFTFAIFTIAVSSIHYYLYREIVFKFWHIFLILTGTLWSFFSNAVFTLLMYSFTHSDISLRKTYVIPLTILFFIWIFVLLTLFVTNQYMMRYTSFTKRKVFTLGAATAVIYICLQTLLSYLLRF